MDGNFPLCQEKDTKITRNYNSFLSSKKPVAAATGLTGDIDLASHLFPFQADVTEFALRQGRCGLFLGTGLGKTACTLEYCMHAGEATNGWSLILTPLAVAKQIEREAARWGYDARVIRDQSEAKSGINICNYDRIDKIDPDAFGVIALDESSILKSLGGKMQQALTAAFRGHRFRLAATATPAPNDHMELGTQAQFLGVMQHREMLSRWFINDTSTASQHWRLKGHAVSDYWDWVASWSRLATMPSDLGYSDAGYVLPPLMIVRHKAKQTMIKARAGELFATEASATSIFDMKRQTADARADVVAALVADEPAEPWVVWCDTDQEADALRARIPDAVEVRGSMKPEAKEENAIAFSTGQARVIITKASICGWGLNWQHCARVAFVGRTFSFESWHQAVRRCHRFGQHRQVHVHIALAEGENQTDAAISRKEADHDRMRSEMAAAMRRDRATHAVIKAAYNPTHMAEVPLWLTK